MGLELQQIAWIPEPSKRDSERVAEASLQGIGDYDSRFWPQRPRGPRHLYTWHQQPRSPRCQAATGPNGSFGRRRSGRSMRVTPNDFGM